MKNQSLLPELISKGSDTYPIVEDLKNALEVAFREEKIRNIALTGPYGSGKSSILDTLLTILPKERQTLRISLATLRVDDTTADYEADTQSQRDKEEAEEALNRKIEYSILQQLIYHETAHTVPSSRLRRILHIPPGELSLYSFGVIVFILSFFIAFEPSWARIEAFYTLFNWGRANIAFDIISTLYMFWAMWLVIRKSICSYSNLMLSKLNLKEASIELNEDTSIFNRYLDEILYFFQATGYDIVIIEDLDRFGTSKVFLKLRELNFLLNESKIIERHIVFLYAVKDDIFKDEERTKFFDYISTIIPIINPSNSKAILKKALEERDVLNDISDDDLSEIAFFIQDMRILKNIANEYAQYYKLLCKHNKHLDKAKLLAMIVYKNHHPQDFALLHRRHGKIYECLSKKSHFVKLSLYEVQKKKDELNQLKERVDNNMHLKEVDLRILLLDKLRSSLSYSFVKIKINGVSYNQSEIVNDDSLFESLTSLSKVEYEYYSDSYNRLRTYIENIALNKLKQEMSYDSRLQDIRTTPQYLYDIGQSISNKESELKSCTFKDLYSHLDMEKCEEYTQIGLTPMMDVFLRLGYIDEEYYDYISYFYEGMISENDHTLLLSIKRRIAQLPSTPIDKIENFYKELKPYMFEHEAILNNNLVDYIAQHSAESFERIMKVIEKENAPLEFLVQYYLWGKEQEKVFKHFISWGREESWNIIESYHEKELLEEAWLRFSDGIVDVPEEWLNANFEFIVSHYDTIGEKRCLSLCTKAIFDEIALSKDSLLDCIITNSSYKINAHNLSVVVSFLTQQEIDVNTMNYSWCLKTNNPTFINYITGKLEECLKLFSNNGKREDANGILSLLNSEVMTSDFQKAYLEGQENRLADCSDIKEEALGLAIQLFLIEPTWDNVVWYFQKKEVLTEELISYIEYYKIQLSEDLVIKAKDIQAVFESIVVSSQILDSTLSQLLRAFKDNHLDGVDVTRLNEERLTLLLGKFAFTNANIEILKSTPIFAGYLIDNSDKMLAQLSPSFFSDPFVAEKILTADKFSRSEKEAILREIPESHLYTSITMANTAIEIICSQPSLTLDNNTLIEIIRQSTSQDKRLEVAIKIIANTSDYEISELLSLLGGAYNEIAEREKRPKLDKNANNEALLNLLVTKGFISSFNDDKDGVSWRVYPPRS